jgi:hypothetical protein
MPLSEHEEKILQEIERQFYRQDPKFARGVASGTIHTQVRRSLRKGVGLLVLGFVVMGAFFFRPAVLVGVAAFLLMLAGATVIWHNLRKLGLDRLEPGGPRSSAANPFSKLFGDAQDRLRDIRRRKDS